LLPIPYRALWLPVWRGGKTRLTPLTLPACPSNTHCRSPDPPQWGRGRPLSDKVWSDRGCFTRRMKPTSGAFTILRLSQACLLGYTPSPQHAFQGYAAHQAKRLAWLNPNGSPGTWYTQRDYLPVLAFRPFHRTVFTAHPWIALAGMILHVDHGTRGKVPVVAHGPISWSSDRAGERAR
jgi:hypothetical protein